MVASVRQLALVGLGLVLATSSAWAAPPAVLMEHKGSLGICFAILTIALVGLAFLEYRESQGRDLTLDIDRLAAAAAQRQARPQSDASALLQDDASANPAQAARKSEMMAPPPPPPPMRTAPSIPPPPPPPPTRAVPTFPSAPAQDTPGNTSGGWSDMLQRVRATENREDRPPSPPPSGADSAKAPPPGQAWEALLRKTSGSLEPSSSPFSKPGLELPGGSKSFAEPAPPPPEPPLPDPSKKRSIALDFNAGGGASNPFQKPPQ